MEIQGTGDARNPSRREPKRPFGFQRNSPIVLFGLTDAGKSSVARGSCRRQHVRATEPILNGRLPPTCVNNALVAVRERIYGEGPHETLHEIVSVSGYLSAHTRLRATKQFAAAEKRGAD